jgi:K+-sensing histidine kinase KdpD
MKRLHLKFTVEMIWACVQAVLAVVGATGVMLLIGRSTLGEAVIALLYLVPIGWSTARWGQGPGVCASMAAALCFDFLFIPPFLTFNVGSVEGWLVLIIFLVVAIVIVGRIQVGFALARAREREAIFMYELSEALAGSRTHESIAQTLAEQLQRLFQADLIQVSIQPEVTMPATVVSAPGEAAFSNRPDRVIPIMAARGLVGEIRLWRSGVLLQPLDDRLLRNFANQAAVALERAQLTQAEFARTMANPSVRQPAAN